MAYLRFALGILIALSLGLSPAMTGTFGLAQAAMHDCASESADPCPCERNSTPCHDLKCQANCQATQFLPVGGSNPVLILGDRLDPELTPSLQFVIDRGDPPIPRA